MVPNSNYAIVLQTPVWITAPKGYAGDRGKICRTEFTRPLLQFNKWYTIHQNNETPNYFLQFAISFNKLRNFIIKLPKNFQSDNIRSLVTSTQNQNQKQLKKKSLAARKNKQIPHRSLIHFDFLFLKKRF